MQTKLYSQIISKVMNSTKFITPEEFIYNMLLPITTIGNAPDIIDESCEILRAYLDEIPDSPEPGMLSSDMVTIAANMTKNYNCLLYTSDAADD